MKGLKKVYDNVKMTSLWVKCVYIMNIEISKKFMYGRNVLMYTK